MPNSSTNDDVWDEDADDGGAVGITVVDVVDVDSSTLLAFVVVVAGVLDNDVVEGNDDDDDEDMAIEAAAVFVPAIVANSAINARTANLCMQNIFYILLLEMITTQNKN